MSYEHNPEWTDKIEVDGNSIVCPECRAEPENKNAVLEVIYENGYYEPRHIPPNLDFLKEI